MNDKSKVLVYGWYGQCNLGDELFKEAFQILWPECHFRWTNHISKSDIEWASHLIFGGGSFLDCPISQDHDTDLSNKSVSYIGVGMETQIHPDHMKLLSRSSLTGSRSIIRNFPNFELMPDLVYTLPNVQNEIIPKSILLCPNIWTVPKSGCPQWKHAAWNYFKSEIVQFLDETIGHGYLVDMFGMCQNSEHDDNGATYEILNQMKSRNSSRVIRSDIKYSMPALELFGKYSCVITQRFHGKILADICQVPSITIAHHDKLKEIDSLSYYGITKSALWSKLQEVESKPVQRSYKIDDFASIREKFSVIVRG